MRKIALIGFNNRTLHYAKDLPEDVEVWTLNWAWQHTDVIPRIDRLFEIHPREYLTSIDKDSVKHLNKLTTEKHPYPVYTIEESPDVDNSVVYPWDEICAELCKNIKRGNEPLRVFTSTFDYMMALAIFEGVDEIRLIGCEMDTQTEYGYQQPGFTYWLGQAEARGISVIQPKETVLLRAKAYHLGGQMLGRQTVEAHMNAHKAVNEQRMAEYNALLGQFQMLVDMKQNGRDVTDEEIQQLGEKVKRAEANANASAGAIAAIDMLFKEFEQDTPEFKPPDSNIVQLKQKPGKTIKEAVPEEARRQRSRRKVLAGENGAH